MIAATYKIAVIPGDGIGKEVMPEGIRVMAAAAVVKAIESVLANSAYKEALTPDMGGTGKTGDLGRAIAGAIDAPAGVATIR